MQDRAHQLFEDVGWMTTPATPQRVFVVEDDEGTREAIVTALVDEGHEVVGLEDGAQLIECLGILARDAFRCPDLVAMDVSMPGQSGIEVLESLRTEGWSVPVVLISSFVSEELRLRAQGAGSSAVLQKPFDLVDLSRAAQRARDAATKA